MTTRDRTRDKLVGSLRKSKGDADSGNDGTKNAAVASAPAARNTAAGKTSSAGSARRDRRTATASRRPAPAGADGYQSGRRVWPD